MAAPVGSFVSDFDYAGDDLSFTLPAQTDGCHIIAVSAQDGSAPESFNGIPARFGTPFYSLTDAENNRFLLYVANGTASAETITLSKTGTSEWTACGAAFDLPVATYAAGSQTYGGESGSLATVPTVTLPASGLWVQILGCMTFSRFFKAPAGVTRHGMATAESYTGIAIGYKTAGSGATGVSGGWEASNTDGGVTLVGTQYIGLSLALAAAASTLSVNWAAEMDFSASATAPVITTGTVLPGATVGVPYSTTIAATGSTPVTWSVASGVLPVGLSLNASTGVVSGTPTVLANTSFTIRATNSAGFADKVFIIQVAGSIPSIQTTGFANGTVGTAYVGAAIATGTTPITWSLGGGALPPGLALTGSTGAITGTPTQGGIYSFVLTASNVAGSAARAFNLTIESEGVAPVIPAGGLTAGVVGVAFGLQLTATGSVPIAWTVNSGTLPAGLVLNGETGVISGTPTDAGVYTATIRATNSAGYYERVYSFIVSAPSSGGDVTAPWAIRDLAGTGWAVR